MQRKFTPNRVRIDGDAAFLELTNSQGDVIGEAIVDTEDLGRVMAQGRWYGVWNKLANAYYVHCTRYHDLETTVLLHRFVIDAQPDEKVDHIHHNTLDCRRSELRRCTHAENMRNRKGAHRNSKSGVRNVRWEPGRQKWRVCVKLNNRDIHVGRFDTLEEAELAAIAARKELHGEFAA